VTTGNISGNVTTRTDNAPMPGVTIEAVHLPTGTRYTAVTNSNGYYNIPNARVGGPYRVTATLEGFRATTAENADVRIGETTNIPLTLYMTAVSEAITVTAQAEPFLNTKPTGQESPIYTTQITDTPPDTRAPKASETT